MDDFYFKCGLLALLDDLSKCNHVLMHDQELSDYQKKLLIELFAVHTKVFHLSKI